MISYGTNHQTVADFVSAVAVAAPGDVICYALGDLGFSAAASVELVRLRARAYTLSLAGLGHLTQRRRSDLRFQRGGACYEYLFTKRPTL